MMNEKDMISKRSAAPGVVAVVAPRQRQQSDVEQDGRNITFKVQVQANNPTNNIRRINDNIRPNAESNMNHDENSPLPHHISSNVASNNEKKSRDEDKIQNDDVSIVYDDSMLDIVRVDPDIVNDLGADNHITKKSQSGAIRVAGFNATSSTTGNDTITDESCRTGQTIGRMEHAPIESFSGLQDGQTTTLEVEGYLPSNNEGHYRVPDENVQRIEHMYASAKAPQQHRKNDKGLSNNSVNKLPFYILLVLIALIVAAVVVIVVCATGRCRPSNNNNNPQQQQQQATNYQAFQTKQELMDAVDEFLSAGQTMTSTLEEKYGNIAYWNVSQIQDFSNLFNGRTRNTNNSNFNADISRWDVSSSTNMSSMFYGAIDFRGDISKWNVSQVTDMSYFMAIANYFDVNLSQWDTSRLVNTSFMFYWAVAFTGAGLEHWDVGNVRYARKMFGKAFSFTGDVSKWDVSNIEDMAYMFSYATRFDCDLSFWNVSNVRHMDFMFNRALLFQGRGLERWNTKQLLTMPNIFELAAVFDADLSNWTISNVNDTSETFTHASNFKGLGLENWDTSNVKDMSGMFQSATSFNGNVSSWDTSSVQSMSYTFADANSFDSDLSKWDVSNVINMAGMFYNATSFRGDGLDVWNVSQVNNTDHMFDSAVSFNANLSQWDISNVVNATDMFRNATSFGGVHWWNASILDLL